MDDTRPYKEAQGARRSCRPSRIAVCAAMVLIAGRSTLMGLRDPLQVQVVGVEPLMAEGLELRLICKLRVQNGVPIVKPARAG
jgi:hypothetical protein